MKNMKRPVGFRPADARMQTIVGKLFDQRDGRLVRNNKTISLDDMAYVDWIQNGKPARGPLTKMGELKREAKVLQKIKDGLLKTGYTTEDIHELMSMFSHSGRKCADCCSRVECDE